MNLWDRRAAQAKIEQTGITVRVADYPGIAFMVRPLCDWNEDYLRATVAMAERPDLANLLRRMRAPGYAMTAEDKALDKATAVETFVRGCVVGWSGVPAPDGSGDWPFTVENAVAFFQHFPDVYLVLRREASNLANFRALDPDELADKIAGNSKRASRSK